MKLTRFSGLLAVALTVGSVAAYAAGNYSMYPVVGGAAICAGTVTGAGGFGGNTGQGQATTGSICPLSVPAGPPVLTGSELIPMDTGLAGGAPPQTVVAPINLFGAGYFSVVATGTTYTVPNGINTVVLNLAATTMAVTMPAAPLDNMIVRIANASTIVSTFSVTANTGQTLVQGAAPTSLAAEAANTAATAVSMVSYIYQASSAKWFRLT